MLSLINPILLMNSEFFTLTLPDLETLIAKGSCLCHIINPNKTRIILWKQIQEDNSELYYLRIGIQKFVSYPLKDKNKALYWRFNSWEKNVENLKEEFTSESSPTQKAAETINPDPNNPITKYQQRLAKTETINNHVNNANSNSS